MIPSSHSESGHMIWTNLSAISAENGLRNPVALTPFPRFLDQNPGLLLDPFMDRGLKRTGKLCIHMCAYYIYIYVYIYILSICNLYICVEILRFLGSHQVLQAELGATGDSWRTGTPGDQTMVEIEVYPPVIKHGWLENPV